MSIENIVMSIVGQYRLRKSGVRYVGPCPECGGSDKSNRFYIMIDGGFKCFSCHFKGDIITWLRKREGMTCPDAHDRIGSRCRQTSCQVADTCRYGDGKKKGSAPKRKFRKRRSACQYGSSAADDIPGLATISPVFPDKKWLAYFNNLVTKAAENILKNEEQLSYLAARGIDESSVVRFGLGWLYHQYRQDRFSLGLPRVEDRDKLWIPEDLVINIPKQGQLHRVRIRRTPESRKNFLPDLKYYWVQGSGNLPLVIPASSGTSRGAVVVEAELDGYAAAAAHPDVDVVAVGSVDGGIDETLRRYLQKLPVILVALDAEDVSIRPVLSWKKAFRHAKFHPTPKEKDAGDYFRAGGDLSEWIEAGLPSKLRQVPQNQNFQDGAILPERKHNEGEGVKEIVVVEKKELAADAAGNSAERDPVVERIDALPEPIRSDALEVYDIITGNPVEVWMSPDGMNAGPLETQPGWLKSHPEIGRKLNGLLYGPACDDIFDIFSERFVKVGRRYGKAA